MGAKASTAAGHQSPRSRTFSSSSTGVDSSSAQNDGGQGFSLLRNLPGLQSHNNVQQSSTADRQRARSLSSVPDIHQQGSSQHSAGPHTHPAVSTAPSSNNFAVVNNNPTQMHPNYNIQQRHTLGQFHGHPIIFNGAGEISSGSPAHALNFEELQEVSNAGASFVESIGLSASNGTSSIWSFNGIKCPICNKFVLPDDIECHLVMCLTKPRLSYNEDVLADAKGECVICLEELNPGDIIARLPCLCIYHKGCIDRWFDVNRSCPEHPGD